MAKKDCELFIKWRGDAGGLNHIRGEKVCSRACPALMPILCSPQVPKFSMEEEALAGQSAAAAPPSASAAVSGRVAQLMGGLGLHSDAMLQDEDDL